jgi:hypothetical protein
MEVAGHRVAGTAMHGIMGHPLSLVHALIMTHLRKRQPGRAGLPK